MLPLSATLGMPSPKRQRTEFSDMRDGRGPSHNCADRSSFRRMRTTFRIRQPARRTWTRNVLMVITSISRARHMNGRATSGDVEQAIGFPQRRGADANVRGHPAAVEISDNPGLPGAANYGCCDVRPVETLRSQSDVTEPALCVIPTALRL